MFCIFMCELIVSFNFIKNEVVVNSNISIY